MPGNVHQVILGVPTPNQSPTKYNGTFLYKSFVEHMWLTQTLVHGNNHICTDPIGSVKQRTWLPMPDRLFKDYIMSL